MHSGVSSRLNCTSSLSRGHLSTRRFRGHFLCGFILLFSYIIPGVHPGQSGVSEAGRAFPSQSRPRETCTTCPVNREPSQRAIACAAAGLQVQHLALLLYLLNIYSASEPFEQFVHQEQPAGFFPRTTSALRRLHISGRSASYRGLRSKECILGDAGECCPPATGGSAEPAVLLRPS